MITEIDRPDTDRADSGRSSPFATVPTVPMLNMIALVTAVMWLLGSVGAITTLADESSGTPALWDYVVAATQAGEYLVVTAIAWSAAAIVSAIQHQTRSTA